MRGTYTSATPITKSELRIKPASGGSWSPYVTGKVNIDRVADDNTTNRPGNFVSWWFSTIANQEGAPTGFKLNPNTQYNIELCLTNTGGRTCKTTNYKTLPNPPTINTLEVTSANRRAGTGRVSGTYASATPITKNELRIKPASGGSWSPYVTGKVRIDRVADDNTNRPGNFVSLWFHTIADEEGDPTGTRFRLNPNTEYTIELCLTNTGGRTCKTTNYWTLAYSPSATTGSATEIGTDSAKITGSYNLNGGVFHHAVLQIATTNDFDNGTYRNIEFKSAPSSPNLTATFTGLTPNTQYWYRTAIRNKNGDGSNVSPWVFSSPEGSFWTAAPNPTTTTEAATNITSTTATLNAVYDLKGVPYAWGGFDIARDKDFTVDKKTSGYANGHTPAKATLDVTGLQPNTEYWYHSVIQTKGGDGKIHSVSTPPVSFWTLQLDPSTATTGADGVESTTAQLHATYDMNGASYTWGGFDIARDSAFTLDKKVFAYDSGHTPTDATRVVGGLTPNTVYYFRSSVKNEGGGGDIRSAVSAPPEAFLTTPDFQSWDVVVEAAGVGARDVRVSGSYVPGLSGHTVDGASIMYSTDPTFSDGSEVTIPLGYGQDFDYAGFDYTITGLIPGQTYYVKTSVTNTAPAGVYGGGTTWSDVKEIRMGVDVSLSKTIEFDALTNMTQAFTFDVTLTDSTGAPLVGPVDYVGSVVDPSDTTITPPTDGSLILDGLGTGRVVLGHGQKITMVNVPADAGVRIVEETPGTFTASHTIDGGSTVTDADTGVITLTGADASIDYTNTRIPVVPAGVGDNGMPIWAVSGGSVLLCGLALTASALAMKRGRVRVGGRHA